MGWGAQKLFKRSNKGVTVKDVKFQLHSSYFSLLNGNVTVSRELYPEVVRPASDYTVPVYDSVPTDATFPYIKLNEWTETNFSDKDTFASDLTFTVQIVDRYEGTASPRAVLYSVINSVKEIIRARPVPFNLEDFNVYTSVIDSETTLREMDSTFTYIYDNIRFRHFVEQLADPLNTFDNTFDETFA